MKVFISWSGDASRRIATQLFEWLPMVLQSTRPYMSSESIEKGTRWASSISRELEGSSVGLLVLTPENTGSPWIHFEAGALAKEVGDAKLAPLLFGLKASDVGSPLSQFQVTLFNKEDVLKLLRSINAEGGEDALPDARLVKMHEALWSDLEKSVKPILAEVLLPAKPASIAPAPTPSEILEEILTVVRQSHLMIAEDHEMSRQLTRVVNVKANDIPTLGGWTEQRLDMLRRLWAEGITASQIAEELGGVSRNAVIGKAHRIGLRPRPVVPPNDEGLEGQK